MPIIITSITLPRSVSQHFGNFKLFSEENYKLRLYEHEYEYIIDSFTFNRILPRSPPWQIRLMLHAILKNSLLGRFHFYPNTRHLATSNWGSIVSWLVFKYFFAGAWLPFSCIHVYLMKCFYLPQILVISVANERTITRLILILLRLLGKRRQFLIKVYRFFGGQVSFLFPWSGSMPT